MVEVPAQEIALDDPRPRPRIPLKAVSVNYNTGSVAHFSSSRGVGFNKFHLAFIASATGHHRTRCRQRRGVVMGRRKRVLDWALMLPEMFTALESPPLSDLF